MGERQWDGLRRPGTAPTSEWVDVTPRHSRSGVWLRVMLLCVLVVGAVSLRQWGSHADGAEGVGAELIGDVVSVAAFTAILELSGLAGRLRQELQGGLNGFAERRTAAFHAERRRALAEDSTTGSAGS